MLQPNGQHCHTRRSLSETSQQIHLPRKQCLINRERHRHTTDEGMTAIDRLSIIWKSDLTDKMKRSFFQAAVVSILLYGCTTWTLTKRLERRLDGNYTRMLRAVLNKSWRQHPTETPTIRTLAPHHKNYTSSTNQTRRTLLEKQGRAHKQCTLLWTPNTWMCKSGMTSTNLHTAAVWGHGM